MHRFPTTTSTSSEIALQALAEVMPSMPENATWHAWWQALSRAAREGAEANPPDWPKAKALWLMGDACSMMLQPDNVNEPFKPFMSFAEGRTSMPQDFTLEDIRLFAQVAEAVQNRALRARLSDLAWLCARPKNIADARRAIDAYTTVELNEDNWVELRNDWDRAISLCMQIRKGAEDRLDRIERILMRNARDALPMEGSLGLTAARLLFARRLGSDEGAVFAELLASRGEQLVEAGGDLFRARVYLDLAAQWFTRLGDAERAADMTFSMALSWESQADQRIHLDPAAGQLVATQFIEDAIQTLRKIPGDQRAARGVDQHLERLLRRLPETGQKAIKAMTTLSTGSIDIREIVERSEAVVTGKPPLLALLLLGRIHSAARFAEMEDKTKKVLSDFALSSMFAGSYYDRHGRVIAKTPGGDLDVDSTGRDIRLWATILRHYQLDIDLIAKAQILPALERFRMEHTLRKDDLVSLMSQAPKVPPGRAEQFAKGLWEGFEHDFASAIAILAPQVEHLVRWHLKESGVSTTNLDVEGVENEIGLSSLVDKPEVKRIFGEDVAFELEALFCSAFGPNLRNEVAHGLLSAAECNTTGVVYAWWWVLNLTLGSFYEAAKSAEAAHGASGGG